VYYKPTTSAEIKLVENLGKVTAVLQELYRDRINVNVVNAAIKSHAYTDESVLLGDLIYPDKGRVAQTPAFQKYARRQNLSLPNFAQKFWIIVNSRNDAEFNTFLAGVRTGPVSIPSLISSHTKTAVSSKNLTTDSGEPVSIYFPYNQQFMPTLDEGGGGGDVSYGQVTSLVTATADADVAWGNQPYSTTAGESGYRQVLVNDEFAYNNPTHIVGVNGIEPYGELNPTQMPNFVPAPPTTLPGATRTIQQVYVGDVRCRKQYDALISFTGNGGGSEIRFTRADGFSKFTDGHIVPDAFISGDATITRWHIRNESFYAYNSEWDGDWEVANLNQNLAIFEEDNRNQLKITSSISTTLKESTSGNQAVGTIGFEKIVKSDDELIRQQNVNHASFFPLNRIDLEGEMLGGWPVRDRTAQVSFILQDRTFIP